MSLGEEVVEIEYPKNEIAYGLMVVAKAKMGIYGKDPTDANFEAMMIAQDAFNVAYVDSLNNAAMEEIKARLDGYYE